MQRQADTIPAFKTLATFSIKSISKGEEGAHSIRHAHGHDLPWLAAGWPCPASEEIAHKDWRDLGSLWIDKWWDLIRGLENLWYLNRGKMYEHKWESSFCIGGHGENVLDESFHGAVVRLQDSCNQPTDMEARPTGGFAFPALPLTCWPSASELRFPHLRWAQFTSLYAKHF